MSDQAQGLRSLRLVRADGRVDAGPRRRPNLRSIAVVSGKGGVGKSTLVTNLAIAMTRRGRKVLLVDGDLALANVDILLGLIPQVHLGDVVFGAATAREAIIETPYGVRLLPAASGVEELANLDDYRREALLCQLSEVESDNDLLLLDTGSGIGRQTLHLALAADEVIIVTTPEPTAFSDAYATLKVLHHNGAGQSAWIVVNEAATLTEARDVARRIQAVARRFLDFEPRYLGCVYTDSAVVQSVRRQEPLLELYPHAPAAGCIETLAAALLQEPSPIDPIEVPDQDSFFKRVANLDG